MDDSLYNLYTLLPKIEIIFLHLCRAVELTRCFQLQAHLSFNCVEIRLSPLTEFELWLGLFKYASPNSLISAISLFLNYSVCLGIFLLVLLFLQIYSILDFLWSKINCAWLLTKIFYFPFSVVSACAYSMKKNIASN